MSLSIEALVLRLADRASRSEATIQSEVRELLLAADFGLAAGDVVLESPLDDRRRIDVEVGSTVIEVKKRLASGKALDEALIQLAGYVVTRQAHEPEHRRTRWVGVLTDGARWIAYHHAAGDLTEADRHDVDVRRPLALVDWLEGVLATRRDLSPTPDEIKRRLGAGSSSHRLDRGSLEAIYRAHRDSAAVRTRRSLWARLLETALGTQFQDSDELFLEHTLLVNTADIIAHAVLGEDPTEVEPHSLLSGERFREESDIHGVVEADFFDWVTEVPGGPEFIRALSRRVARFDWTNVDHDVLKVLYESVITTETRKRLGEYYTPDWLAQKVVEAAVPDALTVRVLDPSCGSGTFLFHAIRRYVAAAKTAEWTVRATVAGVTQHVLGMDLHPVAVSLARVTYILAMGNELLGGDRGAVRVPVFLGDSLQWRQKDHDLFSASELTVPINDKSERVTTDEPEFKFPTGLLRDAEAFDRLVSELADKASSRKAGAKPTLTAEALKKLAVPKELHASIEATYLTLCRLHDGGRDHIWGYYIRNLVRPSWLTRSENRVDVLVGNPPWLSYRFMSAEMQNVFRELSERRGLWHGAKLATQQDLSTLFVVRAMELYLKNGGRFGFVLPAAVLDRKQFEGFRKGEYGEGQSATKAAFESPWDLRRLRPHFFPVAASVVFGERSSRRVPMPAAGEVWSGQLPAGKATWANVEGAISRQTVTRPEAVEEEDYSDYNGRFSNGATIFPRLLFFVETLAPGPLGQRSGVKLVRSARSANEKRPWKDLPAIEGKVEREMIFKVHLGETVLPYRLLEARRAVLPINSKGVFFAGCDRIHRQPELAKWWEKVDDCWNANRSSEKLTLVEQLNFRSKLTAQFSIPERRVVYSKSGMHLAAARVNDHRAVIDHTLYWGAVATDEEGRYLCAVLNSAVVTKRVRPLMSYGKDERHIDKYVWHLPIPEFNEESKKHQRLAELGRQAEEGIAALELDGDQHFSAARRRIREWLETSEVGQEIEAAVTALLG